MDSDQLFAIGDVHGCATELKELLAQLPLNSESTVVFVGDYIDRGPDARAVVDTILELSERCQVIALMGNHEEMLIQFQRDPTCSGAASFVFNGGSATLASYSDKRGSYEIPSEHQAFFLSRPLMFQTDEYFLVHAGVPERPLSSIDLEVDRHTLLWAREPFLSSTLNWERLIVHGHTPVKEVDIRANRINLDTGCVNAQTLSAIGLPSNNVYSMQRRTDEEPVYLRDPESRRRAVRFEGHVQLFVRTQAGYLRFEACNYSPLGLYMFCLDAHPDKVLSVGDRIDGVLGYEQPGAVAFEGHIVRVDRHSELTFFGVAIDRTREVG